MKRLISVAACLTLIACGDDGYQEQPGSSYQQPGGSMANNNPGGSDNMQPGNGTNACPDRDRDGYQDRACNANPNALPPGGDCNDYNNLVNPGRPEDCGNMNEDNDCNGQPPARDQACLQACPDRDNDGYADVACNSDPRTGGDCNDQDPSVNPGQVERCGNRKDDNCSGFDAPCLMNCTDGDADGFGMGSGCYGVDCNDRDSNVNPWAVERCGDGRDQDCDGADLTCPVDCRDNDRDGYGEGGGCFAPDCNDGNPLINPGAREIPSDGIDQDCDGRDLMLPENCDDRDQDGYGNGRGCLGPDCDDNDPRIHFGRLEVCGNRRDDDCQGGDRPCVTMGTGQCMDQDGDDYGMGACPNGGSDCDESNPNVNPGAFEQCNNIDDDCDMRVDECPNELQQCHNGNCVGGPGAPCNNDNQCGPGMELFCNTDIGQCRIRDRELCRDSNECNPTAECTNTICDDQMARCYQAKGGVCNEACDCTGDLMCNQGNGRCVECSNNGQCFNFGNRNQCTAGGFCAELLLLTAAPVADPGVGGLCENTCDSSDDGDCDDGRPGADFDLCDLGTDCIDCGPAPNNNNPPPNPGGEDVDALNALLNGIIRCWSGFERSDENVGCYQLKIDGDLTVDGVSVNQIGDREAVKRDVCNEDWREARFNDADSDVLRELFGCGLFDVANLWWDSPLVSNSGNRYCMFYAPNKSGFGFPDNTRASVVIDQCSLSHID